jgi:hypothetical protein
LGTTNRFGQLNVDPRHTDEGTVEVSDGLGGLLWSLVANIADPPVRETLGIRNMAFCAKVFPQLSLYKSKVLE